MKTPKQEKRNTLRLGKVTIARLNHLQMNSIRVGGASDTTGRQNEPSDACTTGCTDLSYCCPNHTTGDSGITPNSNDDLSGFTGG